MIEKEFEVTEEMPNNNKCKKIGNGLSHFNT